MLSTVAERAITLLTSLTSDQVRRLPPAEQQRLADQCERVHRLVMVEDFANLPRNGVLRQLKDGERVP